MENAAIELRDAVPSDAPAIATVFDAAVRAQWTFLGELVLEPMFEPSYWDELVARHAAPDALIVAADAPGRVIGFTAVHAEQGELFLLFVDPGHAGRGVGRRLLGAAHDALRSAGCSEAFLFTEERNLRALAVYEAAGYRHDGISRESEFKGVALRELRLVNAL